MHTQAIAVRARAQKLGVQLSRRGVFVVGMRHTYTHSNIYVYVHYTRTETQAHISEFIRKTFRAECAFTIQAHQRSHKEIMRFSIIRGEARREHTHTHTRTSLACRGLYTIHTYVYANACVVSVCVCVMLKRGRVARARACTINRVYARSHTQTHTK